MHTGRAMRTTVCPDLPASEREMYDQGPGQMGKVGGADLELSRALHGHIPQARFGKVEVCKREKCSGSLFRFFQLIIAEGRQAP